VLRLVLDLGPLLLFFLANSRPALFLPLVSPIPACGHRARRARRHLRRHCRVHGRGCARARRVWYVLTRHLPAMPLIHRGHRAGVRLAHAPPARRALHQAPSPHHLCVFGAVLLSGLALGKPLLGMLFDSVFHLNRGGLAQAEPCAGRCSSSRSRSQRNRLALAIDRCGVSFKVFGVVPLTFVSPPCNIRC